MFHDGPIAGVVLTPIRHIHDHRGWLIELWRSDELDPSLLPAQVYASETRPGIARGPHEHRRQSDYFVFAGPGDFRLYLWDARRDSATFGAKQVHVLGESDPHAVLVPPGVVHAYRNVGSIPGLVFNCPNRLYAGEGRKEPIDEIRHETRDDSPYHLDY